MDHNFANMRVLMQVQFSKILRKKVSDWLMSDLLGTGQKSI